MRFRFAPLFAAVVLMFVPRLALSGGGWEILYAHTDSKGKTEEARVLLDEEHLRVIPADEEGEFIIGPEAITIVDHGKQTVMEVTFAQLESMFGGMGQMMSAMQDAQKKALEEAEKNMSEEELAAFKEQLGMQDEEDSESSTVEFRPSGETTSLAGLEAREIQVFDEGEHVGTMWTTDAIPTTVVVNTFQRLMSVIPEQMLEQGGEDLDEAIDLFRGMEGFPLKIVSLEEGDEMTLEATSAVKKDLGADAWARPEGYKAQPLPFMGGGMGGMGGGQR